MKFTKKPVTVEAHQWTKHGDHKQVSRYRPPTNTIAKLCTHCKQPQQDHGYINTLEGGHKVCPGDWIITGVKGEHYPCKPDVFQKTYTHQIHTKTLWIQLRSTPHGYTGITNELYYVSTTPKQGWTEITVVDGYGALI